MQLILRHGWLSEEVSETGRCAGNTSRSVGGWPYRVQCPGALLLMKHNEAKKRSRARPLTFVIELANCFQLVPQVLIIPLPLLDLRLLFRPTAELSGPPPRVARCEHPYPVAFSPTALLAALAMEDLPVQQGTPHDLGGVV
jgi:hypothetical protein